MSDHCCSPPAATSPDPRYRRALWIALIVNAAMFGVEVWASWSSGSVSLLADSIDFFGDAANYALSLAVFGMTLSSRARVAIVKAFCMGAFGLYILGKAVVAWRAGVPPEFATMGVVAFVAFVANAAVAWLLYRFRTGDADMRSVWICSRNDALGNAAVMLAAVGVFGTGVAWPDLLVAAIMAMLALAGAATVLKHARRELVVSSPTGS